MGQNERPDSLARAPRACGGGGGGGLRVRELCPYRFHARQVLFAQVPQRWWQLTRQAVLDAQCLLEHHHVHTRGAEPGDGRKRMQARGQQPEAVRTRTIQGLLM